MTIKTRIKKILIYTGSALVDFIFPPNNEEKMIRDIKIEDFNKKVSGDMMYPPYTFIKSIYPYRDPLVKELVWQIKYRKNKKSIEIAGYYFYKYLRENFYNDITLIPIPISKQRQRERGYNQCEIIIEKIVEYSLKDKSIVINKNFNLLQRNKHRDRQTLKNRYERLENSKDIFIANAIDEIINNKIIIIDDVVTTGSTARSAYDEMVSRGYKDVEVLSLSR